MSRGVQKARVDNNHADVVKALRAAGIEAHSTATVGNGFPDVVAGFRSINVLIEIKNGTRDCDRKLTVAEDKFHLSWPGQVHIVSTPEEAVLLVIAQAKRLGVL